MAYRLKKGRVLVLRTCDANLRSRGEFQYPESGLVECPDWNPEPIFGGGLHGLLFGEGDEVLLDTSPDAKGLVLEVRERDLVDLDDRCKFRRGKVVYCGTLRDAASWLAKHAPGHVVHYATVEAGDWGHATVGEKGHATAGDGGHASAGDEGTASAGEGGSISILWWDGVKYRRRCAEVGKGGLKPGVKYKLDENGEFVEENV